MADKKALLARRIRPTVPIEIKPEGVTLQLSFSVAALARIEERVNQERLASLAKQIPDRKQLERVHRESKLHLMGNIFSLWVAVSSLEALRTTFWSAVVENHKEYDSDEGFETIASLMDNESLDAIGEKLLEAYKLFLSKPQLEIFEAQVERTAREARGEQNGAPSVDGESSLGDQNPSQAQQPASSTGSASGPSADSTSDSPLAKSAS